MAFGDSHFPLLIQHLGDVFKVMSEFLYHVLFPLAQSKDVRSRKQTDIGQMFSYLLS